MSLIFDRTSTKLLFKHLILPLVLISLRFKWSSLIRCVSFKIIIILSHITTHSLSFIVHLYICKWLSLLFTIIHTRAYHLLLLMIVTLLWTCTYRWSIFRLTSAWLTILATARATLSVQHIRLFIKSCTRALVIQIDEWAWALLSELGLDQMILLENIFLSWKQSITA